VYHYNSLLIIIVGAEQGIKTFSVPFSIPQYIIIQFCVNHTQYNEYITSTKNEKDINNSSNAFVQNQKFHFMKLFNNDLERV